MMTYIIIMTLLDDTITGRTSTVVLIVVLKIYQTTSITNSNRKFYKEKIKLTILPGKLNINATNNNNDLIIIIIIIIFK